jgi:pyrroline-5-carboxylate reductase
MEEQRKLLPSLLQAVQMAVRQPHHQSLLYTAVQLSGPAYMWILHIHSVAWALEEDYGGQCWVLDIYF